MNINLPPAKIGLEVVVHMDGREPQSFGDPIDIEAPMILENGTISVDLKALMAEMAKTFRELGDVIEELDLDEALAGARGETSKEGATS